jgi:hypothetical protein
VIFVLLQNAWAHNADGAARMKANRRLWLWALAGCKSGDVLRLMLGDDCFERDDVHFDNTTPEVGIGSGSKLKPDLAYIKQQLETVKPRVVVACGRQAQDAIHRDLWRGSLLSLPHPAFRYPPPLKEYREAKGILEALVNTEAAQKCS